MAYYTRPATLGSVGGLAGEVRGNASVRYSLYRGFGVAGNGSGEVVNDVTGTSSCGFIIGNNRSTAEGENKVEKNYYFLKSESPKNADDRWAYAVSYAVSNPDETTDAPWLELDFGPSIEYANSGITAYENILKYDGKYFAGKDENVVFGLNIKNTEKGTYIHNVRVNHQL